MPIPHDPSEYIKRVIEEIPNINSIILLYLEESIRTYNIGALFASSVMLGCATEKAFLLLIESYSNSLAESKRTEFINKTSGRPIKRQYDEFSKRLTTDLGTYPKEISENLITILLGIFEIIRSTRNDSGHPTGKKVDKSSLFALLQIFIEYCKKIYQMICYYEQR